MCRGFHMANDRSEEAGKEKKGQSTRRWIDPISIHDTAEGVLLAYFCSSTGGTISAYALSISGVLV